MNILELHWHLLRPNGPALRCWRVDDEKLSAPERIFLSVWELEADVNDDGFWGYVFNSTWPVAPFAAAAPRSVGAARMAEIVDEAVGVVGSDALWLDEGERQGRVVRLSATDRAILEALDQRSFAYPDNLTALLYAYVSDHRAEIGVPPEL
jgi:hypothetical protein